MKAYVKEIICDCCSRIFFVCRKCYRGQAYCSVKCQEAGYREKHRERQKKYQNSEKGKKTRSRAGKRRRKGLKKGTGVFISLMKTCVCLMMLFSPADKNCKKNNKDAERCELCSICEKEEGRAVETFPRRPYGKTALCGIQ